MGNSIQNTTLYRAFNNQAELLYVGISSNFMSRLGQHHSKSKWHKLASKITLEHFETRQLAEQAEIVAIHKEKPLFNKKDNEDWHNSSTHLVNLLGYEDLHHRKLVEAQTAIIQAVDNFAHNAERMAVYCYAFQSSIQLLTFDKADELEIPCVSCEKLYYQELMEDKAIEFAVADSQGFRAGLWGSNDIWEATVKAVKK